MEHKNFSIGFIKCGQGEHMFLSVTPGFEYGPGILRDGITKPRMTDPHHVQYVRHALSLPPGKREEKHYTEDAFLQRAGTWTYYQHLKQFIKQCGKEWLVIGCQSCGDLTMNPWHVAYLGDSHISGQHCKLCALSTDEDPDHKEPFGKRVYHSLVKWRQPVAERLGKAYEFLDLQISNGPKGPEIIIDRDSTRTEYDLLLKGLDGYNDVEKDIGKLVHFTLSGKPIVDAGIELALSNAIDRFQDVRHIFNLPAVAAHGVYNGQDVNEIIFGEYQLFGRLNERRAALQTAVRISLNIESNVAVKWADLEKKLLARHFRAVSESPTKRGDFRKLDSETVEIFYPHNVYPFGVIGLSQDGLVCLASGGLSGRVGNTLEGITRIMFDFFGCADAMVLDEGFDTFQIVNPSVGDGVYKFTNEDILLSTLSLAHHQLQSEVSMAPNHDGQSMRQWPLNIALCDEIENDYQNAGGSRGHKEVFVVQPHRSQMRSIIIYAVKK